MAQIGEGNDSISTNENGIDTYDKERSVTISNEDNQLKVLPGEDKSFWQVASFEKGNKDLEDYITQKDDNFKIAIHWSEGSTGADGFEDGGYAVVNDWSTTPDPAPSPDTYTVTYEYTDDVPEGANAVLPTDDHEYEAGDEVKVAAAPELEGYTFDGWYKGSEKVEESFIMPENDVTLTGSWTENDPDPAPAISDLEKKVVAVNGNALTYKWENGKLLKLEGFDWVEATLKEGDVVTYQITLKNTETEAVTVEVMDNLFGSVFVLNPNEIGEVAYKTANVLPIDAGEAEVVEGKVTVTVPEQVTVGKYFPKTYDGKCEIAYSYKVDKDDLTIPVTGGENYVLRNDVSAGGKRDSVEIPTNIVPDETTEYTVTFHYNYKDAPKEGIYKTVKVEEGKTVAKPSEPTRDGEYTFLGWTTEEAGKEKYDFDTPVTSNLDLYAQWRAEVHRVEKAAVPTVYTDAGQKIQYFVLLENHNTEDIEVLVEDAKLDGAENIYYVTVDKLISGRPEKVYSDNDGAITVPVPAQYESTVKTDIAKILEAIFGSMRPGAKTMGFDFDDLDWKDILSKFDKFEGCDKLPDFNLPECSDQEIVIPGYTILTYTYTTTAEDKGNDIVNIVTVGKQRDSATVKYKNITVPDVRDTEFHTMFKQAIVNKVNDTLKPEIPYSINDVAAINVVAGAEKATGGNKLGNHYTAMLGQDHWYTMNVVKIVNENNVSGLEIVLKDGNTVNVDAKYIRTATDVSDAVFGGEYITEIYLKFDVTFDDNGTDVSEPASQIVEYNGKAATPDNNTWYKDKVGAQPWDFDTDVVTKDTVLYAKPVTPPEEDTSAIVRFYVYDANITEVQNDVTDEVDGVDLSVDAGYAFLNESVKVEGLKPGTSSVWNEVAAGNTASAEWMTDHSVAPKTGVTAAEVITALNSRGAGLTGEAKDYKLELKNIGWEPTDAAYHVHYVLVKRDVPDKEADLDIEKELVEVNGKDYNGKKVSKGDELTYYITVDNFDGTKDASFITVIDKATNLKNGEFIGIIEDRELVKFNKNDEIQTEDDIVITKVNDDEVLIDELPEGASIVLVYEGTVSSSSKDVTNVAIAEDRDGEELVRSKKVETGVKDSTGGIPSKNRPTKKPTKVDEVLNTEDHFQYVQGYPDNTVGPERNITRAEATVIFFRLLNDSVRTKYLDADNAFSDVNLNDWFNLGVSTMENGGFVSGYDDGLFRPNANITRAELATIISNFDDLEPAAENKFADVEGHWAEKYINSAAEKGWLSGYEDGLFRPNQYITRAETMSMINRVLDRRVDADGLHAAAKQWKDNPESKWYYYAVLEATNYHEYERAKASDYENWTAIKAEKIWEN